MKRFRMRLLALLLTLTLLMTPLGLSEALDEALETIAASAEIEETTQAPEEIVDEGDADEAIEVSQEIQEAEEPEEPETLEEAAEDMDAEPISPDPTEAENAPSEAEGDFESMLEPPVEAEPALEPSNAEAEAEEAPEEIIIANESMAEALPEDELAAIEPAEGEENAEAVACTHPQTEVRTFYDNYRYYDNKSDSSHTIVADAYQAVVCTVCEAWLSYTVYPDQTGTDVHVYALDSDSYYSNICTLCGHINSCSHVEHLYYSWQNATYQNVNDPQEHVTTGLLTLYAYCDKCGALIYMWEDDEIATLRDTHSFDDRGVCTECGYAKACTHPSVSVQREARNQTCAENAGQGTHTWSADVYEREVCDVCGLILSDRKVSSGAYATEAHTWQNGVCTACGAKESQVNVNIKVTKITLSATGTVTLPIGQTLTLTPTLTPANADNRLTWTSAKPAIASVNANGLVTALSEGKAKITVKATSGKKATVTIQVTDPYKPTGVAFQNTNVVLAMGETTVLTPVLTPSTARTTFTWKSNKPKIATVSVNGTVTPVAEGTAKITVTTANKKKATVSITVVNPYKPQAVSFADAAITVKVGASAQLAPVLTPSTARASYTYKSAKTKIATVSANGLVTGVKPGSTTISVTTDNKKKATIAVVVIDRVHASGIKLSESGIVPLKLGGTINLSATLSPANAETSVVWSTASKNIATVSGGRVTGVKVGRTTITAKADGASAKVDVLVYDPNRPTEDSFAAVLTRIGSGNPMDNADFVAMMRADLLNSGVRTSVADKIIQTIRTAPELYRNLYVYSYATYRRNGNAVLKDFTVSYFAPNTNMIYMDGTEADDEYLQTWFHESGHAIDWNAGMLRYDQNHKADYNYYNYNETVYQLLQSDVADYIATCAQALKITDSGLVTRIVTAICDPEQRAGILRGMNYYERQAYQAVVDLAKDYLEGEVSSVLVSDMMGGITDNLVVGYSGHFPGADGESYWTDTDARGNVFINYNATLEGWGSFLSERMRRDTEQIADSDNLLWRTCKYFAETVAPAMLNLFKTYVNTYFK